MPRPVPPPPPEPDPVDSVFNACCVTSTPGSGSAPAAVVLAGMLNSGFGGSGGFSCLGGAISGGRTTGTELFLARQLRLARRLLHLIAAATAAPARARFRCAR